MKSISSNDLNSIRLAIVVPLANEEATVDDLLTRMTRQINANDKIFCILDKACRDTTKERIAAFSLHDPRVVLVYAPQNRCVVDAYFRGYHEALSAEAQWILEMDGGLSHLPEQIPAFVDAMKKGADFAGGSRFMAGGNNEGPFYRKFLSRGGTVMANLLLGTSMTDMTSGFQCFTRAALAHVVAQGVGSRAHFFQTEIRYMMHRWSWVEVPISYSNPSKGLGTAPVFDALKNLWRLFRTKGNTP